MGRDGSFEVAWLENPKKVLPRLKSESFDLVLLDLGLMYCSGQDLLQQLRSDPQTLSIPVIILTAKAGDKLPPECLNLGADDFIRKPWKADDLLARIKAVLRRTIYAGNPAGVVSCGGVRLDVGNASLVVGGQPIRLTETEFHTFRLLMENRGRALEKRLLLKQVWGLEFPTHKKITTRRLDKHVQNIRDKLGRFSRLLETVPSRGYRFNTSLAEVLPSVLPSSTL